MRDYGVVRVRFWEWAKRKALSDDARQLALYFLTCPHSNTIGFYRVPTAYIADDMGWVSDRVCHTVSELFRVGFLKRENGSGWTWIRGYLEHNPIPNSNVGKSVVPLIEAIPAEIEFYQEFISFLEQFANRLPNGLVNRMRYRSGTVCHTHAQASEVGMPTHDHDQTHEQEHDHDEGAGAPANGFAFEGQVFRLKPKDLDRWRKAYHAVPDIEAALRAADDYYTEHPLKDGQKWFFAASNWLKREHERRVAEAKTKPDPYRGAL